jgi:hypothetical protein
MSSVDRQNKLIAAEDWKRIYQSFKNADFQSYDFDNLRRTMVAYLRENYPEDFNDYIESSEYLALIDLIAFLGQNLAFRFDLNARENFLELAERRESVLRLARLLSYNAKRNQPSTGLLKFTSVSTTESILDSNGRDLSEKTIVWNDSTNSNWYEQFIKVINAALPEVAQFGKPYDSAVISGVPCQQYRFNATNTETAVYGFTKSIDGRNMPFEIVSSSFRDSDKIYEEDPYPGRSLAFIYRDDSNGTSSSNTGFFCHFRQGTLQESTFAITRPSTTETVDLDSTNINNTDIWLYDLDSVGFEQNLWTKVDAVEGNNVIYNSISKGIRKIYSVLSKTGDRVRLSFADGVFGDLPQGNFKVYFRTSNGLTYTINPNNIRNVSIDIPYLSKTGKQETLSIAMGLFYSVNNATSAESSDSIKRNAPSTYYTQNRMITGEDYNVLPLSINQEIIKIKSVNRTSSGISRYFDLKDASGKYSHTNLFATDGVIYKEDITDAFTFTFSSLTDIENTVSTKVETLLSTRIIKDFYLDKYPSINLDIVECYFVQQTTDTNFVTGFVASDTISLIKPQQLGSYVSSILKYVVPGAMIKFTPPVGKIFSKTGVLVDINTPQALGGREYIWSKVIKVTGDGTANSTGLLSTGLGPVIFNDIIPTGAILSNVIPKFVTMLEDSVRVKIVNSIFSNKNFGIRYDINAAAWRVISESNLNTIVPFALDKTGDTSSQQQDSSWTMLFESDGETYTVTSRGVRYVFESEKEIRFFFDGSDKVYDTKTGTIIRDKIVVLGINTQPDPVNNVLLPFNQDFAWEIVDEYLGSDGYIDTKKISISFYDSDEDGVVDDPERFLLIVSPEVNISSKFIYQQRRASPDGVTDFYFVQNNNLIIPYQTTGDINISTLSNGQLVHMVSEGVIKQFNSATSSFVLTTDYRPLVGRSNLKFQYIHAADESSRLDPSASNIMDVFVLTKTYDINYRRWIRGEIQDRPLPLSSDALYINFGSSLNKVKAISDEIIYHPVKYKALFGAKSNMSLQATFKVVKNSAVVVSDADIKSGVVGAINEFFDIENWEFGDTFYFSELSTYIMNKLNPNIVTIVLVPRQQGLAFGSLYEIKSNADEILVSSATVDDVEIITEITASRLRSNGVVLTSVTNSTGNITSA